MFKLIKLGKKNYTNEKIINDRNILKTIGMNRSKIRLFELEECNRIMDDKKFSKIPLSTGGYNLVHHECFEIIFNSDDNEGLDEFIKEKNINFDEERYFSLLKYNNESIIYNACDRIIDDEHKYNCMIFIKNRNLEGGNFILHDSANTFKVIFEPSKLDYNAMIIFSSDLLYDIEPIRNDELLVLKKPIFVKEIVNPDICDVEQNEYNDFENTNRLFTNFGHWEYDDGDY